jgi:hypothetical protein
MQVIMRAVLALTGALLLAGCGGSSGSGGNNQTPPVIVAPSPAPTPTPTASSSPPPLLSYDLASDFTRDQSYETFGTIFRSSNNQQTGENLRLAVESYGPDNRLTVLYTANPARAVLRRGGATGAVVVDYSVLDQRSARAVTVRSADANLSGSLSLAQFGPTAGNLPIWLDYVIAMNGNGALARSGPVVESASWSLFGGVRTASDDLPTSGVVRYSGYLSLQGLAPDARTLSSYIATGTFGNPGFFEVIIDFSARTLTARAVGQSESIARSATFTIAATLPASSREWDGTIVSDANGTGTVSGSFFGPRGRELGLVISYREGDRLYGGTLIAVAPAS